MHIACLIGLPAAGDLDESLAPPPIDSSLKVEERLQAIRVVLEGCQGSTTSILAFDVKEHYRVRITWLVFRLCLINNVLKTH